LDGPDAPAISTADGIRALLLPEVRPAHPLSSCWLLHFISPAIIHLLSSNSDNIFNLFGVGYEDNLYDLITKKHITKRRTQKA
jgi:hypothetical protein